MKMPKTIGLVHFIGIGGIGIGTDTSGIGICIGPTGYRFFFLPIPVTVVS